ncbi:MAG: glycosyltransferase family 2 protein [bacterium]
MEVSVIMPCLNEEKTIGICIKKAFDYFKDEGIDGEVIVVDNGSTDNSANIASSLDAKVVYQPVKGYGSAYLMGLEKANGEYIIMADADNTYDLQEIGRFLAYLRQGYEFCIGSRFKGKILEGAMPWSHQYIGNPILTWILNLFFGAKISDAHCGMRAVTKEAYKKMDLKTIGMEFASEMVIKALKTKLKIKEIPITYHPRQGESKLDSFRDGWRHLRFMLLYSPTYLFLIPGMTMFFIGLVFLLILLPGPLKIGNLYFGAHYMVLGSLLAILGFQIINLGLYAKSYSLTEHFEESDRFIEWFFGYFNLERGLIVGTLVTLFGLGINIYILVRWILSNFGPLSEVQTGLVALTFMVIGIQIIFSSFFLSILGIKRRNIHAPLGHKEE